MTSEESRAPASYEFEIDVLRGALRKLVWHIERADDWDAGKQRALNVAIESARTAIDRTDWRAE